jgi:hypothetical protein
MTPRAFAVTGLVATLAVSVLAACSPSPTAFNDAIEKGIQETLSGVHGPWTVKRWGLGDPIDLQLALSHNDTVITGTWQFAFQPGPSSARITGSFVRPRLTLNLTGMTWNGIPADVRLTFLYITVSVVDTLHITTSANGSVVKTDIPVFIHK